MILKTVEYSQIVRRKLNELRMDLTERFGEQFSQKTVRKMTATISSLGDFENMGASVKEVFGIECEYHYLFVGHNYFFYRVENDRIIIMEMFHEKEDFMRRLFGISTTSQETIDYWGEEE